MRAALREREFTRIGVIGLGTMGAGIAEVFARNGYDVIGVEITDEAVERGREHLQHSTDRAVTRGKLTEAEQAELLGRITFTTSMKDLADADFVVEAVVESLEIKKSVFRELDDIVGPDAILATNTSSLSVTEISTANHSPGRVVGVHFFNPAPVQRLVEVIRTVVTEPEVLADVERLLASLGKSPVVCGDKAGFIANTLLFGYLNHAVAMYEAHYATREDIDAAMRFGCGYPMGPLALLDLIGLDTAYEILDTMYKQGRDRLHAPAPILKQMVTAGLLGRKSGRGFYTYEAPDSSKVVPDDLTPSADDEPQLRRDISRSASSAPARWPSGIVEVFAKAGYDVLYVGRSDAKVEGVRETIERSLDKAIQRGKLEESARGGGARAGSPARPRSTTSPTATSSSRRSPRTCASRPRCSRTSTRSASRARSWPPPRPRLPIITCAMATKRPQDVVGMHFFNPAPIMKLVEVVSTVATADDVAETVRALCAKVGKVRRLLRRPGRLHRQRAAVPLPQRRGEDARGALRHRRRHRHRDEARLRAADGPVRAARRGRQRRVAGDPARALPGVPRARLRARAAAGAPGHRRLPRPQDQARFPRLHPRVAAERSPGSTGER